MSVGIAAIQPQTGRRWVDSMDAITAIRNSLIHPDSSIQFTGQVYYETWRLALWYIDMALLRLCNHSGNYANRLSENRWKGVVEPVPWR
jgi:hypothetical protein